MKKEALIVTMLLVVQQGIRLPIRALEELLTIDQLSPSLFPTHSPPLPLSRCLCLSLYLSASCLVYCLNVWEPATVAAVAAAAAAVADVAAAFFLLRVFFLCSFFIFWARFMDNLMAVIKEGEAHEGIGGESQRQRQLRSHCHRVPHFVVAAAVVDVAAVAAVVMAGKSLRRRTMVPFSRFVWFCLRLIALIKCSIACQ